jgi:diguanylate cyclase (GGDEF)-like protein
MKTGVQPTALARLLLIQNVLEVLPSDEAIASFLCRSLSEIPGVGKAQLWMSGAATPNRDEHLPGTPLQLFPLRASRREYGTLILSVSCQEKFFPYQPYIENTVNVVANLLERRDYVHRLNLAKEQIQQANEQLEVKISERTAELTLKNCALEREVNERKRLQEILKGREETLRAVLDTLPVGVAWASADTRNIEYANGRFSELFGYSLAAVSSSPDEWYVRAYPDAAYRQAVLTRWESVVADAARGTGEIAPVEARITCQDGSVKHILIAGRLVLGRVLAVFNDISEQTRHNEELEHLANHDSLTGLPNRSLLQDRLSQAVIRARRHAGSLAVLFIDLDRFKTINDNLGHHVGDELLKQVATRVRSCLREEDTLARQGGDEFVIILPEIGKDEYASNVAESLRQVLTRPFHCEDSELFTSASIGIAVYPRDGHNEETLLRNADSAMYRAKELGRNNVAFYAPEINEKIVERFTVENALRHGLERNEFVVYYQPQLDLRTGRITGFEALVRWQHPQWGLVLPGRFIPVAEETGQIVPLGRVVLLSACRQAKAWRDAGFDVTIAVNVSARELREKEFVRTVKEVLALVGLEPACLELELTESVLVQQPEAAAAILCELRDIGIQFSLDDFGTGYSSLSYLQRFPFSRIKIDRSFIENVITDAGDVAIVCAIIAMAQKLKLTVIAEGVETKEQEDFLRAQLCDAAQGYRIARPLHSADATALLEKESSYLVSG